MTCTDKAAEIKPGDRFEIQVDVESATDGGSTRDSGAYVTIGESTYWLSAETLLAGRRVARPLGIGDRVKFKNASTRLGTIRHIDGAEAWVRWGDNDFNDTEKLSDLERAPAPDTKEGT